MPAQENANNATFHATGPNVWFFPCSSKELSRVLLQ